MPLNNENELVARERSYDLDKMLDRLEVLEQREQRMVKDTLKVINDLDQRLNLHEAALKRLERAERACSTGLPESTCAADLSARLAEVEAVCAKLKHCDSAPPSHARPLGSMRLSNPDGTLTGDLALQPGDLLYRVVIDKMLEKARDWVPRDCAKHIPGDCAPDAAELERVRAERDELLAGFTCVYQFLENAFEDDWFQTTAEPLVNEMLDRWEALAKQPQHVVESVCKAAQATEPSGLPPAAQ